MSDVQKTVTNCTTLLRENIDERECEILAGAFQLQKLAADEILLSEGHQDDSLHIVIDGDIVATR